jgi:fumarate reductase flavoprotein subunit
MAGAAASAVAAGAAVSAPVAAKADTADGSVEGDYCRRVSGKERFAVAPAKASELGEPDYSCDWLVVGAGNTGLFGAVHGLELGMETILLEASEYTGGGGAGTEATQLFNDSKYLAESGTECGDFADIYHYFGVQNAWLNDGLLFSNYVKYNHGPHDWLYDHDFGTVFCSAGGLEAPVGGIMYEGMGSGVNAFVTKTFKEEGGTLLTQTRATKLVVDDEGAVVGAIAENAEEGELYISAKNVFLGTGGFGANPDMVAFYIGEAGTIAYKRDEQVGIPHLGDGICMALGVGGVESQEMWAAAVGQGSPANFEDDPWDSPVDWAGREPFLWVNDLGKRLGNENWQSISTTFGVAYRQNGGYYWNVFDQDTVERMQTEPFIMGSRWVIAPEGDGDPIPEMGEVLNAHNGNGGVVVADTLEELAEACGIDYDGLAATVERYNGYCEAGEDLDFYKDPSCLLPVAKAPFYAVKQVPTWFSTLNGVVVDEDLHVLDENDKPIPGLFAGGADASQFFMTEYNHHFGGSCSAFSYFCGWYAAEVALASL